MERRRTKKINRLSGGSTYQDKKEIGSRCQNKKFFDSVIPKTEFSQFLCFSDFSLERIASIIFWLFNNEL